MLGILGVTATRLSAYTQGPRRWASGPDGRDGNWANVLCSNCGLLLEGDPMPEPLEPPFEQQGEDVFIVCE